MTDTNQKKSSPLGPDTGYVDILDHLTDEKIKRERAEGKDTSKNPLRPSAAGKCTRELAYELMEFHKLARYDKEVISPETHRIFSLGHSVEYHIIRQLDEMLRDYFDIRYKQQTLSFGELKAVHRPEFNQLLEGSTDLVLWSKKHKCIADIKSKKAKYSSYRNSDWEEFTDKLGRMRSVEKISDKAFWVEDLGAFIDEIRDPFLAANFFQLNLYACNPFIKERGIDHASIIQYNKNTSQLREVRFKPCQKIYDYVIQKFQTALHAVDNGNPELAEKEHALGTMKCAFCSFNKICWSEDDPKKAFFRNLPKKTWARDTNRLEGLGEDLEALYEQYKESLMTAAATEAIEEKICNLMVKEEVQKVRFADQEIYEVKLLKSPREHFELRRSKN